MDKQLFTELDGSMQEAFSRIYAILDELIPMKPSQRRELPYACKDLSEYLTTDREFLSRPYWTSPRLLSAYFRYFMVWNLIRLTKLFPGLEFKNIPNQAVFLDLGTGPLTIPLALWLSRKDLRKKEITFICTDIAPQPLQIGKSLFEKLRQELDPKSPWKIQTLRAPMHKVLRQLPKNISLITMGNVLNEGDEKKKISAYEQISHIYGNACGLLAEHGKIFAVEPGTRQGARMIQILRGLVTEENFGFDLDEDEEENDSFGFFEEGSAPCEIISPCPHESGCPLAKQNHRQSAWCHFNAKADAVPKELKEISQKAGLDKDSVSLSFLYVGKKSGTQENKPAQQNRARIISDAFPVPNYKGRARYACHPKGLLLVLDCADIPSGTLCGVTVPQKAERDHKSKAILCTLSSKNIQSLQSLRQTEPKNPPANHKKTETKETKGQQQKTKKKRY